MKRIILNLKNKNWVLFTVTVSIVLAGLSFQPQFALAMGKMKAPISDWDEILKRLSESLTMNPAVKLVQGLFLNAKEPIYTNTDGELSFTDAIQAEKRYDCRVFYALSRQNALVGPESQTWYQFKRWSDVMLDNKAYDVYHRIKTYVPHTNPEKPEETNELWGMSDDRAYYESLRVRKNGDLMIMGYSERAAWGRAVLGIFNMEDLFTRLLTAIQGFQMPANIWGIDGLVIGFGLCPKEPSETFFLIGDDVEALKFLMFEQEQQRLSQLRD